jgi:predicted nucleic acid-binding protein
VTRIRRTLVADTSAVLALLDADDRHHEAVRALWERAPHAWVLPWAILPEVDYLARRHLGAEPARLFLGDVVSGAYIVEPSDPGHVRRALELDAQYAALDIGLVDGVVAALAEKLHAEAIVTLDVRHFGALELDGNPKLYPRDVA